MTLEIIDRRYLNSIEWYIIKKKAIQRDGGKCVCCGKTNGLLVHHKSYEHYTQADELELDDIITVCVVCHRNIHRQKKLFEQKKNDWYNLHKDDEFKFSY